uniref:Uncharacterized protein n=1 Tax=Rhizobium phage IG49 TaxID=3129228 RepID=A0AAU8HZQ1_9CAUD
MFDVCEFYNLLVFHYILPLVNLYPGPLRASSNNFKTGTIVEMDYDVSLAFYNFYYGFSAVFIDFFFHFKFLLIDYESSLSQDSVIVNNKFPSDERFWRIVRFEDFVKEVSVYDFLLFQDEKTLLSGVTRRHNETYIVFAEPYSALHIEWSVLTSGKEVRDVSDHPLFFRTESHIPEPDSEDFEMKRSVDTVAVSYRFRICTHFNPSNGV